MTIEEQIANIDRCIRDHEAALSHLNEKRRELVNRGNLKKCPLTAHQYNDTYRCVSCGVHMADLMGDAL